MHGLDSIPVTGIAINRHIQQTLRENIDYWETPSSQTRRNRMFTLKLLAKFCAVFSLFQRSLPSFSLQLSKRKPIIGLFITTCIHLILEWQF